MKKETDDISNRRLAVNGALIVVAAVLLYSLLIMIYVGIRSSVSLLDILPAGERKGILLAGNFNLMYAVAVISLLVAAISSPGGALGALVLKKLLIYFNPGFKKNKAGWIGFIFSFIIITVVYFLFRLLFGEKMGPGFMPTFLFWFLIPAAIALVVCTVSTQKLNRLLSES